jgi:hypothetical protein
MSARLLRSRRLTLTGLALAGLLLLGATSGQAADPFRAGGRSTRAVFASADHVARAQARGEALIQALAIPAARHVAVRLADVFDHRTYDEVTSFDPRGREVAISRFDLDGGLAMAVALGWQRPGHKAVDADGAVRSAAAIARLAGVQAAGRPAARASAGAGGWSVTYARVVDGVTVRGDGLRMLLWPDGSFHGLTRTERPLAGLPPRILTEPEARAAGETVARERFASAFAELRITRLEQAWVAPNDTFGPAGADAPAAELRLAWTVRLEAHGDLAGRLRQVELWLDAGDGHLLGGDVVQ